jgi:hypothetical protein
MNKNTDNNFLNYKSPKQKERDVAMLPPIKLAWQDKIRYKKDISADSDSLESGDSSRPISRKGSSYSL